MPYVLKPARSQKAREPTDIIHTGSASQTQNRLEKKREGPWGGKQKMGSTLTHEEAQSTTVVIGARTLINLIPIMLRKKQKKIETEKFI